MRRQTQQPAFWPMSCLSRAPWPAQDPILRPTTKEKKQRNSLSFSVRSSHNLVTYGPSSRSLLNWNAWATARRPDAPPRFPGTRVLAASSPGWQIEGLRRAGETVTDQGADEIFRLTMAFTGDLLGAETSSTHSHDKCSVTAFS